MRSSLNLKNKKDRERERERKTNQQNEDEQNILKKKIIEPQSNRATEQQWNLF